MMKGESMAEKIFKRCFVFGLVMVIAVYQGNVGVALADTVIHEKVTDLDVPDQVNLTKSNKKIVSESKEIALDKGKEAGEKLLGIDSDKQYKEAVSEVLEKYYEQDEITPQLESFTDTVKPCAEEEVSDYKEAYEERMESDSLSYNPEKVILRFRNDVSDSSIREAMDVISDGGKLILEEEIDSDLPAYKRDRIRKAKESKKNDKIAIVDLSLAQSTDKAIDSYKQLEGVLSAEKDQILEVSSESKADQARASYASVSDPYFSQQWSMMQTNVWHAWSMLYAYRNYTYQTWVAVIDSGVDMDHEDLQGQFIERYCVDITKPGYPFLTSTSPQYTSYHGTHVAGIINAKQGNPYGIAGVAAYTDGKDDRILSCKLMAIKATYQSDSYYSSDVINAICYAADKGADIINLSMGGFSYSSSFKSAIDYAYKAGVTVVAEAGDNGKNMTYYPADYNHVISVISTNNNKQKTDTSNFGAKDISAPGANILSTLPGDQYGINSGTSMAAAFVTGVVALMKEADYLLKPDDLTHMVTSTATDIGAKGYDPETANGLIYPYGALQKALARYK